jgi:hypothetical protein
LSRRYRGKAAETYVGRSNCRCLNDYRKAIKPFGSSVSKIRSAERSEAGSTPRN